MNVARAMTARNTSWLQVLSGLFFKPLRLQIAALCVRPGDGEPDVLLVSTRDKGRLILPKGWPEADKPAFRTAVIEAYEEAGVVADAAPRPLGSFRSFKGLQSGLRIRTRVLVFQLRFERQLREFPEKGERSCHWLPLSQAIERADEPALRRFLRRHARELLS